MKTTTDNPMQNLELHGKACRLSMKRDGKRISVNLQTAKPAVAIQRKQTPYSPTPIPSLTVNGAAGTKANS